MGYFDYKTRNLSSNLSPGIPFCVKTMLLTDKTGQYILPSHVVRIDGCERDWVVSHVGAIPTEMECVWKNQADFRGVYLFDPNGKEELIVAPENITILYSLQEVFDVKEN